MGFRTGADAMAFRQSIGMAQNQFAAYVGVTPYVVRQWENFDLRLTDESVKALVAARQRKANEG